MHSLEFAITRPRSPLIQLSGLEQYELSSLPKETIAEAGHLGIELDTSQPAIQMLYPMGYCCHMHTHKHTRMHAVTYTPLQTKAILLHTVYRPMDSLQHITHVT